MAGGALQFNVSVIVKGGNVPQYIADRLGDLTEFFNIAIVEWTKDNQAKFLAGIGAESAGTEVDPGVYWKPLSPGYLAQKSREGLSGALMVRTGSLKAALTDPGLIMKEVSTDRAIFGEPLDPFDALKVSENWDDRQAIFFSGRDQMMIKEKMIKHLSPEFYGRTPYSESKSEIARMNAEFEGLMGNASE